MGGSETTVSPATPVRDIIDGTQGIDTLDGGSDVDTCLNGELVVGCEHSTLRSLTP